MKTVIFRMLSKLYILVIMICLAQSVKAQEITGTVSDRVDRLKLEDVDVFNQTLNKKTKTNAKGEFRIEAYTNNILIFNQPGYVNDTLFLINLKPVRRYLNLNNNYLKLVEIKADAFKPELQYADVYRKAKAIKVSKNQPFIFYPSKYFSREGKFARRFKRKLEREKTERKIDFRFNEKAVTALTPLKGRELDYFMVLYRPTLTKLGKMDAKDLEFYLMAAYKEFKALPENKRVSPHLKADSLP
ncbi:MAG TPA: hypothetical protein VKB19_00080 [Pedobacter sp.]|nr:hypothetical protein [Pedobacter sp.]